MLDHALLILIALGVLLQFTTPAGILGAFVCALVVAVLLQREV
jgi:hypothetical protein